MQLQQYSYAKNADQRLLNSIDASIIRDKAVSEVTVTVDTSQWSPRMRSIVVESIRTGVASCGWQTASLIKDMLRAFGLRAREDFSKHTSYIDRDAVRPDKLDELAAYTSAWIKLAQSLDPELAQETWSYPYDWSKRNLADRYQQYLQCARAGRISQFPLNPTLSPAQKREFALEYLRPDDEVAAARRAELADKIAHGESITFTYRK